MGEGLGMERRVRTGGRGNDGRQSLDGEVLREEVVGY